MKKLISLIALLIIILAIGQSYNLLPKINLEKYFPKLNNISNDNSPKIGEKQTVVYEESVITKVVEESLPSVVTVGIMKTTQGQSYLQIDPFNPFGGFTQIPGKKQKIDQNIGSGFIVSKDGFIITNKHVVADEQATYKVLTNDKKEFNVEKIYRDPLNDLAILKVNANNLKALSLSDSSKLKLGQMTIAVGTPLGEFTNTVTTGIVSGLGASGLLSAIGRQDITELRKISGVGKKTAERLIVELREQVGLLAVHQPSPLSSSIVFESIGGGDGLESGPVIDAILALEKLGFDHNRAQTAVKAVINGADGTLNLDAGLLVRDALSYL